MRKKYILKRRVKFQKVVNPESEKHYDNLQRLNKLRVKNVMLKKYKTDSLREALSHASRNTYWRKYWAQRRHEERCSRQCLALQGGFYVLFLVVVWVFNH